MRHIDDKLMLSLNMDLYADWASFNWLRGLERKWFTSQSRLVLQRLREVEAACCRPIKPRLTHLRTHLRTVLDDFEKIRATDAALSPSTKWAWRAWAMVFGAA